MFSPLPTFLRYDLESVPLPEAVAHEACRVFRDRLVEGGVENFNGLLQAVLNSMINFRWPRIRGCQEVE